MVETIANSRAPFRRSWFLLLFVVAGHCTFNLTINPMGFSVSGPLEWLKAMFFAVMFAQPVLFAEWAVLGPGAAVQRVPLTLAAAAAVAFCGYYIGWNLFNHSARASLWSDSFYWYVWALAFPVASAVLIAIRRLSGWRIVRRTVAFANRVPGNQFSLKYLLMLTAVCAAFLGTARFLAFQRWPGISIGRSSEAIQVLIAVSVVLLALFPTFVVPLIALTPRPTVPMLISIPLTWAALSWLALETVIATNGIQDRTRIARDIALLQGGAALAGLLSALVVRIAGYRLLSGNTLNPAPSIIRT